MRNLTRVCRPWIVAGAMFFLSACASQPATPETSADARQQDALKHPFDYSPGIENPNISGGGIGDFDSKAFGKDLNDVFNP